ncbi:CDKN2A-interacting protein-like [Amblyraja radiata]|uniref:CDKN2A-interacting protein-like n=1 Tax=Amblyraja radiata TaxID=386614 RepID=UPI0014027EB0|nr:CDKN2A-interacting protein-like [Amblyraja radiata]
MAADEATDELLRERPALAAWLEELRGGSENQRHWEARRRFIINNLPAAAAATSGGEGEGEGEAGAMEPDPPPRAGPRTDRLLALSMVWANHVFLGCRYSKAVMDKVLEMGEGIKVTDAPVHTTRDEVVANKKKREIPSTDEKAKVKPSEKKKAVTDVKTIDFVAMSETAENVSQEVDPTRIPGLDGFPEIEAPAPLPGPQAETPACPVPTVSSNQKEAQPAPKESEVKKAPAPVTNQQAPAPAPAPRSEPPTPTKNCSSNSVEAKPAAQPDIVERLVPAATSQKVAPQPAASQSCKPPITVVSLTPEAVKEKQTFYNKLYKAVAWKLVSAGGYSNDIDHLAILSNCIQATKGSLDSVCIPLKDISELHLPHSAAREGIVCELRCQSVYLATGYGKCKVSAKDMAAKEAVKLFLKQKVTVKMCKRKFKGTDIEDLVLLSEDIHRLNLAPALMNPLEPSAR